MADDILDELDDEFDEESMEDILEGDPDDDLDDIFGDEDDLEVSFDESGTRGEGKTGSIKDKLIQKAKPLLNQLNNSKKAIIIIVTGLGFIIFLATGTWWVLFKSSPEVESQVVPGTINSEQDIKDTLASKDEVIFKDIIDFEPFDRIPLKTSSTMGSCSINMSIELIDHRLRKQIYGMEDRIRDIVVGQIAEMTWLELRNPEGKIMLKYNLLKRINAIFPKPAIRNIYFTYFIMQ